MRMKLRLKACLVPVVAIAMACVGVTAALGIDMTTLVSVDASGASGNGYSAAPMISADGIYVVFESGASNLVPGDLNGTHDIFVKNRLTGVTEVASVDSSGNPCNDFSDAQSISANGRFVAFRSAASNLVPDDTNGVTDIFVHDRWLGTTERVSVSTAGEQGNNECYY